jgi:hypothetical protein
MSKPAQKKAPKSNRHLASPGSFGSDWFGADVKLQTAKRASKSSPEQLNSGTFVRYYPYTKCVVTLQLGEIRILGG